MKDFKEFITALFFVLILGIFTALGWNAHTNHRYSTKPKVVIVPITETKIVNDSIVVDTIWKIYIKEQ